MLFSLVSSAFPASATTALKKNTPEITVSDITSADKLIFQKHNNFGFFVFFFSLGLAAL